MELIAIDALLTVVGPHHNGSLRAWTQAALFACELAEQEDTPLWRTLPQTLESAGWEVESNAQQAVPLPQLAALLRTDPVLVGLLDRRGGVPLQDEAAKLLDAWWQCSLASTGADPLVALVGTLNVDAYEHPRAQLYALTLPAPSWRWLVRAHLVQARLNRLSLKLDAQRHAPLAPTLAERNRARQSLVRRVKLDLGPRGGGLAPDAGLAPGPAT